MKKLIFLIIIFTPIYFLYNYNNFKNTILTNDQQIIEITKWDTYRSLANKFDLNQNYLKVYLKLNPPINNLQAWNYRLEKWLNLEWVISSLKNPISTDLELTILEWWNIYDIDSLLAKKDYIKNWDLIKLNREKLDYFKKEFSFLNNAITLEWFLYPDTYAINPNNFNLETFVNQMLKNFEKKVIKNLWINPNDIELLKNINLASIVEKEEKKTKEKPIVAWILKKRLEENWFIWADATVCYPYEFTFDECTPSFIWKHITDKNDYNTRNKIWLPKTPICNPSADSIEAVYNSKESPYYFYLHDSNWQIHYARTNEEHVGNKMLYIK